MLGFETYDHYFNYKVREGSDMIDSAGFRNGEYTSKEERTGVSAARSKIKVNKQISIKVNGYPTDQRDDGVRDLNLLVEGNSGILKVNFDGTAFEIPLQTLIDVLEALA